MSQRKGVVDIIDGLGLTRNEVAEKTKDVDPKGKGISVWTIHYACSGNMSAETRELLAKALKVPANDLGEVNMQSRPASKGKQPEKKARKSSKKMPPAGRAKRAVKSIPQIGRATPAIPDRVESISVASPLTVPAEIDDKAKDALVTAIFKVRKSKGFSQDDVKAVEKWADDLIASVAGLNDVLKGKAGLDVTPDNQIVVIRPV